MSAPPSGESPMYQRPLVERTIESPMASPRPRARAVLGGPVKPVEQARPVGFGDAGPAFSTIRLTRLPWARTWIRTWPSGPE